MRILAVLLSITLVACGGGGGGGSPATPAPVLNLSTTTHLTSYRNQKLYESNKITIPVRWQGMAPDGPLAWGIGDFLKTGKMSLFIARQNYGPAEPLSTSLNKSDFTFWTVNGDGTITQTLSYTGCLHPRKGVVADFNQDGTPDVFVACHGYDASPWPGEKSKLVLSDGQGGFTVTDTGDSGFYHGASAADVNNDGYPDIVVANIQESQEVYFYINNRDGTFTKDFSRVYNIENGPYFSVELVDVNNDGIHDLIVGGHEQYGSSTTRILYGDNTGKFGVTYTNLPAVAGRGVVLDFTLVDDTLFIGRTSDEYSTAGFYATQTLQKVNLTTLQSSVVLDSPGQWIAWWIPMTVNGVKGAAAWRQDFGYFFPN